MKKIIQTPGIMVLLVPLSLALLAFSYTQTTFSKLEAGDYSEDTQSAKIKPSNELVHSKNFQLAGVGAPSAIEVLAKKNFKEWWLYTETNILPKLITPGKWYRIANSKKGQIRHGHQRYGINLVWRQGERNVKIFRPEDDPAYKEAAGRADFLTTLSRYIRSNEPVAIYIKNGGYLVYDRRRGVDLGWQRNSDYNPFSNDLDVYQWQFRDISSRRRDHRNRDLKTKEVLALYNTKAKAYLVYGSQWGIDLKWVN